MSTVASEYDSPPSPTLSERAAEATELRTALATRLKYARFKSTNACTRQSLAEVENLNFSPFAKQAAERQAKKVETLVQKLQGSKQIPTKELGGGENTSEKIEWYEPVEVKMSEVRKGKQRESAEKGGNPNPYAPTPSFIHDQPFPVPYLAICPAKPPSRARTASDTSVETVVEEETQNEIPHRQKEPEFTPQPPESDNQSYTATELLALRSRNDFSPSSSSLLHRSHHRHSPFSQSMATTLAPASSSSTIDVPSVLAPLSQTPSQPNSQESSTTSSSQSSSHSLTLNLASQASFSALPPPPPLEFGAGTLGGFLHPPASSQQRRQEQRIRRIMDEAPGSSQEEPAEPASKRARIASNEDEPTSSSPPPVSSFPFSLTQSQSSSSTLPPAFPSSSQSIEGGGGGYYYNAKDREENGEEEGESQETQTTEGAGESQETDLGESQELYADPDGGRGWSMRI